MRKIKLLKHDRVNFLSLFLELDLRAIMMIFTTATLVKFEFGVYRKPGNALA